MSEFDHLEIGNYKDLDAKNRGFEYVIDPGVFTSDQYFKTLNEAKAYSSGSYAIYKLWRMRGDSMKFGVIRELVVPIYVYEA